MSNLKCPFCQQELEEDYLDVKLFGCENQNCKHSIHYGTVGTKELWQELICTRKALDVAQKAMLEIHYQAPSIKVADKILTEALKEIKTALEQKDK